MNCVVTLFWLATLSVASCSAQPRREISRGTGNPFLPLQQLGALFRAPTETKHVTGQKIHMGPTVPGFILEKFERSLKDALKHELTPFITKLQGSAGYVPTEAIDRISLSLAPLVAHSFGTAFTEARDAYVSVGNLAFTLDLAKQIIKQILHPLDKVVLDAFTLAEPKFSVPLASFTESLNGLPGLITQVFANRSGNLFADSGEIARAVINPCDVHLRKIFAIAVPGFANGGFGLATKSPGLQGATVQKTVGLPGHSGMDAKGAVVRITTGSGTTGHTTGGATTTSAASASIPTSAHGFKPRAVVITSGGSRIGHLAGTPAGVVTTHVANGKLGNHQNGAFGGFLARFTAHGGKTIF